VLREQNNLCLMFVLKFHAGLLRAIHSKLRLLDLVALQIVHPKYKDYFLIKILDI